MLLEFIYFTNFLKFQYTQLQSIFHLSLLYEIDIVTEQKIDYGSPIPK